MTLIKAERFIKKEQQSRFSIHEISMYSSLLVELAVTYVLFKVEPKLR